MILIPIVIKIGDNRDFEKYSVEEKRNLARAIYNSTMVYEEDKKLQEIKEDNFVKIFLNFYCSSVCFYRFSVFIKLCSVSKSI